MVTVDPERRIATLPAVPPDMVVHPCLGAVGMLAAYARGDVYLHGGAFTTAGGTWGVLADKEGGKSTLLALLARAGVDIVADDVLIVRDGTVLAGPRAIDLRPDAGAALGVDELVRHGERVRVGLPPTRAEHELRGWISVAWGETTTVTPLAPTAGIDLDQK